MAVSLVCTAPIITYVGDVHLGMEVHVGDTDDSEKDSEDEKDSKDLISDYTESSFTIQPDLATTYGLGEYGILNEDHLELFTPPPEL